MDQPPEKAVQLLKEACICFFFAQQYHSSMKYVGAIRKELGFRTVFNILGPLTNPAKPSMMLLGVYDEVLLEPLSKVLTQLGVKRGLVVYGQDKLDEISLSAPTSVYEIKDGYYRSLTIRPEDFGLARADKAAITGGSPEENAAITRRILAGSKGPQRDIVLLNAGAGFYIAQKAAGLKEGIQLAEEVIDSGRAAEKLDQFIRLSNAL